MHKNTQTHGLLTALVISVLFYFWMIQGSALAGTVLVWYGWFIVVVSILYSLFLLIALFAPLTIKKNKENHKHASGFGLFPLLGLVFSYLFYIGGHETLGIAYAAGLISGGVLSRLLIMRVKRILGN